MNDNDRREWVMNDEYLYNSWLASKFSLKDFIAKNRNKLTPADRARGYQCDACADRDEGGGY